jgi:hypothetical protein
LESAKNSERKRKRKRKKEEKRELSNKCLGANSSERRKKLFLQESERTERLDESSFEKEKIRMDGRTDVRTDGHLRLQPRRNV